MGNVIREVKLTQEQWELCHRMAYEADYIRETISNLLTELAELESQREVNRWNEIARLLGYESYYDATRRGVKLVLSLCRGTVFAEQLDWARATGEPDTANPENE